MVVLVDAAPVHLCAIGPARKRGEQNLRGDAAISERDSRRGRGGGSSGDAGDNFKRHIGAAEGVDFFSGAAEDAWVAAFEANYELAVARVGNQQRVDFVLRQKFLPRALANVDDFDGGRNLIEHFPADQ